MKQLSIKWLRHLFAMGEPITASQRKRNTLLKTHIRLGTQWNTAPWCVGAKGKFTRGRNEQVYTRADYSRYTGEKLRAIRARVGVGRPPKMRVIGK